MITIETITTTLLICNDMAIYETAGLAKPDIYDPEELFLFLHVRGGLRIVYMPPYMCICTNLPQG